MVTLIRSGGSPHGGCAAAALLGLRRDTRLAGGEQLHVAVKQPDSEYGRKGDKKFYSYSDCLWTVTKTVGLVRSIYMREDFIVNNLYLENKE
ncbi:hypothetical protein C2845_PM16G04190 [Panicum miliaceum]|uniref:Uncharacterized protein n=1 Tax=Panicum miliaceum TaxID=4540 RepID=A0A3L6PYG7_PANMI|nr:hypothetical protein C2845_PM16G04190 [Panicum miliaceum]